MLLSLVTFVLLALTLSACLCQFLLLKRELWRQQQSAGRERDALRETVAVLEAKLAGLGKEIEGQSCFIGVADSGGINFSRRTRVLRMHRRGDRPDQIAAALNVPVNEVKLLLKLQHLSDSVPAAEPTV
jgi:hypothetical protein